MRRKELFRTTQDILLLSGMGYEESLVRDVIKTYIEQHSVSYHSTAGLLEDVMKIQRYETDKEINFVFSL